MSAFVSLQSEVHYELFAVIAHVGLADFGHYCAYIRNPVDGKWFCFNDSHICWVRNIIQIAACLGLATSNKSRAWGYLGPHHEDWSCLMNGGAFHEVPSPPPPPENCSQFITVHAHSAQCSGKRLELWETPLKPEL